MAETNKLFGLTSIGLAAIAILLIGIGVITAIKPAVGVVCIIGMYATLNLFVKDPKKTFLTTAALFVVIFLFWGSEIQHVFSILFG